MAVINGKLCVKFDNIDIEIIKKTLSLDDILVCIKYKNAEETIHECKSNVHKYIIKKGVDKVISVNSLSIELKYNMFNMICIFNNNKCIINWCGYIYQEENDLIGYLLKYLKLHTEYNIVKIYPITEMYKMPDNFHKRNFVKYLRTAHYKFSFDGITINLYNTKINSKCIYFRYVDKDKFLQTKFNIETILSNFLGYCVEFTHNICIEI